MKTLKAIKGTKQVEVGTVIRVDDKEADLKVKDGYWKYVPKSEYKGERKVEEQPKIEKPVKEKKNAKSSK